MRDIPEFLKHLSEAKVLEQAQKEFLQASEELLAANRSARAKGELHNDEIEQKTKSLNTAQERMDAAEKEFELATKGMPGTMVGLSKRVAKMVQRTFSLDQQPEARRLLEQKCVLFVLTENTPEGLERNRLAVIKLAAGNLDELKKQIEVAKVDWRDVINPAEYPESSKDLSAYYAMDQETREKVERRDRQQYLEWLGEDGSNSIVRNLWNKISGSSS